LSLRLAVVLALLFLVSPGMVATQALLNQTDRDLVVRVVRAIALVARAGVGDQASNVTALVVVVVVARLRQREAQVVAQGGAQVGLAHLLAAAAVVLVVSVRAPVKTVRRAKVVMVVLLRPTLVVVVVGVVAVLRLVRVLQVVRDTSSSSNWPKWRTTAMTHLHGERGNSVVPISRP
jgi:hypothetical protein